MLRAGRSFAALAMVAHSCSILGLLAYMPGFESQHPFLVKSEYRAWELGVSTSVCL